MVKPAVAALCLTLAVPLARGQEAATPTYSKDIAPILNQNCVVCHRTGEIGPMPLTSYKEIRPFVKSIRQAVAEGTMPPWHADPKVGRFANERRLTDDQIKTVLKWVSSGAPEGDPNLLPPAPQFAEGWTIGKPDVEIAIPKPFEVPADGVVDYQYMVAPTNFKEDKWVSGAEVRPGNREIVHHVIAFILPPEGETPEARGRERDAFGQACPQAFPTPEQLKRLRERAAKGLEPREFGVQLVGWAPGLQGVAYHDGAAKKIRAGSRIMFQLHYTPSGKAGVDKDTKVGLIFAKGPVTKTIHTLPISNQQIVIPPGEPNYEAASCYTVAQDLTLLDFMPHMHLRGKDFIYRVTFPDGRSEALLSVPKYDFGWQTLYRLAQPLKLPKGSKLDCTAHFDNSPRNKYNPDAAQEVRWGDQTWEEMMIGWVTFVRDLPPPQVTSGGGAQ